MNYVIIHLAVGEYARQYHAPICLGAVGCCIGQTAAVSFFQRFGRLALLPSRDVLMAQLAGAMAAPLGTMAGLLAAPLRNLGAGLAQLADQRGGSGA